MSRCLIWDSDARTRRDHLVWLIEVHDHEDVLVHTVTDVVNCAGWRACVLADSPCTTILRQGPRCPCPPDRWLRHLVCRLDKRPHREAATALLRRLTDDQLQLIVANAVTSSDLRDLSRAVLAERTEDA